MLRVGLTGGIASGKTHVLRRMAAGGVATLDLDVVAHEVMAPGGAAYDDVRAAFGEAVLAPDRTIDRKALGAIVFRDPEQRARLNRLVHPRVREEEARRVAVHAEQGAAVVVTDAALLVESGVHLRFDRLVLVSCRPQQQLERLMARDGWSEAAARDRLSAQLAPEEKRRFAHLEIDTSGSREETDATVDGLVATLGALAALPRVRVAPSAARVAAALQSTPRGPGGLTARDVLAEIAASGLELPRLAARIAPGRPWYQAGEALPPDAGPEPLMLPVALWAAARGADREWLAGAALSVGWLTQRDPVRLADGCLAALLLHQATGAAVRDAADQGAIARRWCGAAPQLRPASLAPVLAALREPGDDRALDPELEAMLSKLA